MASILFSSQKDKLLQKCSYCHLFQLFLFIHSLKIHIQKSYYCRQFSTDGLYMSDYKTLVSFEYLLISPISMKQNSVLKANFYTAKVMKRAFYPH